MSRFSSVRSGRTLLVLAMVGAALIFAQPFGRVHAQESAGKPAAAPAGNADNGKKLYKTDGCYQCHSLAAQGGTGTGPRIAPNPLPWPAFNAYVRAPKNQMPPYSAKLLKDADLADIYAYLKSIPEPPKVKDIPLLNGN